MDIDNVLDKVDKETESVVDAVDKVDGEKDKVEGQSEVKPDGKNGQESNNGGWITQLPKELREGIDPGLLREVKENGLGRSPAFVEAVRVLGERTNEKAISSGGSNTDNDAYDPKNPLRL